MKAIDVSKWNGPHPATRVPAIDWNAVVDDGVRIAWIRCSCGRTIDPQWVSNWTRARNAGLIVGCYHFWTSHHNLEDNLRGMADAWLLVDTSGPGILPPVLDVEQHATASDLLGWLSAIAMLTERIPWIYTAAGPWPCKLEPRFTVYPLWVADYTHDPPWIPSPWVDFRAHQYTNRGRVRGVATDCDISRVNLTEHELAEITGAE